MSILASDNFNRADETPLAGNWTKVTGSPGTLNLSGNSVTFNAAIADSEYYYNAVSPPADQFSRAKLTVTGTVGGAAGAGVMVRVDGVARSFYRLTADHAATNNVDLGRRVTGTYTSIVRFTQAWTDGDTWELQVQGTTLRVLLNGVQVGSDQVDANIATGTFGMVYSSTSTAVTFDDWAGGDIPAVPSVPGGQVIARVQSGSRIVVRPQGIVM